MASGCITRDQLLEWLSSARGKDKLFRLVGYTSYFVSDSKLFLSLIASAESSKEVASSVKKLGSTLSQVRAACRLLDLPPAIQETTNVISNFLSPSVPLAQKTDVVTFIESLMAFIDTYYCPFDHISWAIDNGIIKNGSDSWGLVSTKCWALCLYLNLAKSCIKLRRIRSRLEWEKNPLEVSKLKERQLYEILTMVQYGSDLMNAMNILPGSWLNPLNVSFTTKYKGIFGMIASAVGIYKMFRF